MSDHALLSASSAHRWLECPPSARLEKEFPETMGEAAAQGSEAHTLAEYKLKTALKSYLPQFSESSVEDLKRPNGIYEDAEMDAYTDDYVDFVLKQISKFKQPVKYDESSFCLSGISGDPLVLIEQKIDFSKYVSGGFGTADCVIVSEGNIHIIDFKYGQGVLVEAVDNPQLKLYALGALNLLDNLSMDNLPSDTVHKISSVYNISSISMTIFQPRRENISSSKISKESLYKWADEVLVPTANLAFNGIGEYKPGEHCRFCRASIKCRARAEYQLELAKLDFADPPTLSDEELSRILLKLDDLILWANSLKEYALKEALNGKYWQGFKLVEGRSVRRYSDEKSVSDKLKSEGFGMEEIYKTSLLSLTELEKKFGKKKVDEILRGLIIKPPGKPALVSISDKRTEICGRLDTREDFKGI
ncbi:MAG: DUF2800 domain-containing protein [Oscillospiraceae bacterium]|jgi:hypothetical protein|nr:DUF2800 domain-containing protein [Oscillospiraceae bacterium]